MGILDPMHPPGTDVGSSSTPLLTMSVLSSLRGIARHAFHRAREYPETRAPKAEGNSTGGQEGIWDQVRPEAHGCLLPSREPLAQPKHCGLGVPRSAESSTRRGGWGRWYASRVTFSGCRMRPQCHRVLMQTFLMCFQPAASNPRAASCQKPAFGQPSPGQTHSQKRNTRDGPSVGSDNSGAHWRRARSGHSPPCWWTAKDSNKDKLQEAAFPFETSSCKETPYNRRIITEF